MKALVFNYEQIALSSGRLLGAKHVKGSVITFLDAHCECTEGWLEPLLAEIAKNRKAVVCPIIDVISDDTFEYVTASDMTWGGFNWKLNFRWYRVPQREMDRRGGDRSQPLYTPAMAGGLFAIDKVKILCHISSVQITVVKYANLHVYYDACNWYTYRIDIFSTHFLS